MYILHVGLFILLPSPLVVEFCSILIIPYKYIIFILIYVFMHMFIFMIVIAYVGGCVFGIAHFDSYTFPILIHIHLCRVLVLRYRAVKFCR